MPHLLVVHHTASPSMDEMLDAVLAGARDPDIVAVEVSTRAALSATASDLLAAEAVILGAPANGVVGKRKAPKEASVRSLSSRPACSWFHHSPTRSTQALATGATTP